VFESPRLTVAAAPAVGAALKLFRDMPATLPLRKLADETASSGSVALSASDAVAPSATLALAGQLGTMAWLPPPPPQGASGDALLRGAGVPALKSAALLLVSVQPAAARRAAVVAVNAGAAVPSKKLAPP
jgi:hypothetical protein